MYIKIIMIHLFKNILCTFYALNAQNTNIKYEDCTFKRIFLNVQVAIIFQIKSLL